MKSNARSVDDAVGILGRMRLAGEGDLCPSESVRIYKNTVEPRNNRHTEKIAEPLTVGGKGWPLANPAEAPVTKVWVNRETSATSRSPTWIIYIIRAGLGRLEWGPYYVHSAYCYNAEKNSLADKTRHIRLMES